MSKREVYFTLDAFTGRRMGGVRRIFEKLFRHLPSTGRPCRLAPGFTNGRLPASSLRAMTCHRPLLPMPRIRGIDQLVRLGNRVMEHCGAIPHSAIIHPTYFDNLPTCGNPLVATVFDTIVELFPDVRHAEEARRKTAMIQRADILIAISNSTRNDLVRLHGIPESKVRVVHLGSDSVSDTPVPVPQIAGESFLLWVGSRGGHKNFLNTIRGLALSGLGDEHRLLCAGGGPLQRDELHLLRQFEIEGHVTQRDLTDGELAWAYANTLALVYTSSYEGFGLPILEAFRHGAPVVTSDVSAMPEVGGPHAVYAQPALVESIAEGISEAVAQGRPPDLVAARRKWAAQFTWERCAVETDAVYATLD